MSEEAAVQDPAGDVSLQEVVEEMARIKASLERLHAMLEETREVLEVVSTVIGHAPKWKRPLFQLALALGGLGGLAAVAFLLS